MAIKVTISNPNAQRVSSNDQQRAGVRQIGITSSATLDAGTVQSVAIATTEGLNQTGSPITVTGTITVTANTATTAQTGITRLNDSLTSANTGQALTANMGRYLEAKSVQNTRTISTTSPLAGGGDLSADRTLTIQAASISQNGEVRLNDTLTSQNTGQALTANMGFYVVQLSGGKVQNTRTISTTSPLAGGGDLTADRTLTIQAASTTQNGEVRLNDTLASANLGQALTANMGRYLEAKSVPNTRSVLTTGGALTGGGTLVSDLTLTIANASTAVNGVVRLNDTLTSQNTGQALTANMGFYIVQREASKVQNTTTISTTSPLAGGGDLTTNRTLTIQAASTTQNGEVRLNDTLTSTNIGQALTANMGNWVTQQLVGKTQNTRTISTTSPLAGGGDLTADRTLTIQAASTTQNGEIRLNDTTRSSNNFQAATANVANILARVFDGNVAALVPANTAGNGQYLLTAAGTWVPPPVGGGGGGSGTVTSVSIIAGSGLAQTGTQNPITTAGSYTITANDASVSVNGVVRLQDSITSTNTGQALTANMGNWITQLLIGKTQNTRAISTTAPLTGGGDLTADRTLAITAASTTVNGEVRLNDTLTSANTGQALTANMGRYLEAKSVQNTRTISTTSPLTGGGTLGADRTFAITAASTTANGEVRLNDTLTSSNTGQAATANIVRYLEAKSVQNTRSISTTSPLTGGGDLTTDRTLTIQAASTTQNGEVRLNDTLTSSNNFQAVTANVANILARVFDGNAWAALVPANNALTNPTGNGQYLLTAAGTWIPPGGGGGGSGTVTFVSIVTGSGLSQTGTGITTTGTYTLTANDASTSVNGVVRLNDTLTSANTGQALTANMGNWIDQRFVGKVQNTTTISTTSPLAGGGDLTTNRTLSISAASTTTNGEVRLNDTLTSTNVGQALTANIGNWIDQRFIGKVQNTTTISTTSPLTGGGDLTTNRTLAITAASTTVNGEVRLNDTLTSTNVGQALTANMGNWITQQLVGKTQNTRTISTTSPLTGGGDLTSDRTFAITAASTTANGETRLNDTLASQNVGQALTANMGFYIVQREAAFVANTRTISTTAPLTGGGDLTTNRTLAITAASTTVNGEVRLNDSLSSSNVGQALTANMGNWITQQFVGKVQNTTTISTTSPLSGGGDLTTNRTLSISAASTTVNGEVRLNDTLASANVGQALTANMGNWISQQLIGKTQNTRTISTTSPLTGGGDLTSDRTFAITAASTTANGEVRLNDTLTSANVGQALTANMGRYLEAKSVQNTRTISTTSPLAGGGDLTTDRTLTIQAASITQNGEVRLNDTFLSMNLGQAVTANVANALARIFTLANSGLVPAPITSTSKFLRDDATWQSVAGAGTVTSVTILTGSGLAQTGTSITSAGTYTLTANDASTSVNGVVRLNDTLTSTNTGQALTANMGNWITSLLIGKVQNTVTVSTTAPLTGGGDLSTNRTLAITAASLSVNGEVRLNDTLTSSNNFQAATANVVNILARVFSSTFNGLVPASPGGVTLFLREDGTWQAAGSGGDASLTANGIVRLNDTLTSANIGQALTANMGRYLEAKSVQNTRTISTTSPLTGGGDLTTDRTFAITAASTTANGEVRLNDTLASSNVGQALTANMGNWITQQFVGKTQNTRSISTTSPLTGGGDLTADRTFTITAASTTANGETRLNDTLASQNVGQALTANMGFYIVQREAAFVANTRAINTTSPLSGGGALTADRTIAIQAASTTQNGEVRLNDSLSSTNTGQALTANIGNWISQQFIGKVQNTTTISTTSPLTGGGDLTTNRTLAITAASTTVNGEVRLNDTLASQNVGQALTANMGNWITQQFVGKVQNTRSILTTSPLSGGGDLTADRTLIISAASTTVNGEVRLNDTLTSANLGQALTANMGRYLEAKSVPNTRQILTTGGALTGGGTLVADLTLTIANASTTVNGVVRLNDSLSSSNVGQALTANMGNWITQQFVGKVQNTTTISTTSPLTGGGDLTTNRTLVITAASITANGETRLNDTLVSQNTGQALTANMGFFLTRGFTTVSNGMVPAPLTVTAKFLRDDGSWQAVAGSGTVTSVDVTALEGIFKTGGPITTADSITIGGNNFTTTTNGFVPKPVTVTNLRYLTDNASWSVPVGSGGGSSTFDYGRVIAVSRGYFLY